MGVGMAGWEWVGMMGVSDDQLPAVSGKCDNVGFSFPLTAGS